MTKEIEEKYKVKFIRTLGHQGDIWFHEIESLPENLRELKTLTVARGEATGHHHTFRRESKLKLLALPNEQEPTFIDLKGESILEHQEHKEAVFSPEKLIGKGAILITRELEYNPFLDEIRKTVD